MESPSEEGEEPRQQRPRPCPECESTRGYASVGKFRVQCLGCNALLKREEVDLQLPNEETR
jgi:hypothetical protein